MMDEHKRRVQAVGRILRAVRLHRGLSQDAVAKAGQFDRAELSLVEHGKATLNFLPLRRAVAQGMGIPQTMLDLMVDSPEIPVAVVANAFGVGHSLISEAIASESPKPERAPRKPSARPEAA